MLTTENHRREAQNLAAAAADSDATWKQPLDCPDEVLPPKVLALCEARANPMAIEPRVGPRRVCVILTGISQQDLKP